MKELTFGDIKKKSSELMVFEIPQWEGFVYIKPMTVAERLDLQEEYFDKGKEVKSDNREIMLSMLEKSVVSSQGVPLFTDETIGILASKDWAVVSSMFQKCAEVNVLNLEGEEAAKKK